MQPWISLDNIQKSIDRFSLGPISIDFEPGTITALIGENGSGKTTLCKMVMHLVKPSAGDIHVRGVNTRGDANTWKHYIAYQPQKPVGYGIYTGEQLQTFISKWYPNWDQAQFDYIVENLEIPLQQKFDKMSEGAQQKLLFALTIARNTDILLLDEPTAHLDIPSKRFVIDTLVDWMDEKERMIIISSHQMDDIRKLSDYLCVLHDGEMIGNFIKESLQESFKQYWFVDPLPSETLPGERLRQERMIVSENAVETEAYCREQGIKWEQEAHVDLEEIITHLLTHKKQ